MADLDSQPKTVQSLYSWYSEGKLFVNRRYQRKLVWTLTEKQKLVESALRKYPIPAILLAEREGGSYEIIDGLQRLHTLVSFIEAAFPTFDSTYFDVSQFPTANTRARDGQFDAPTGALLSPREVSTLLDYSLAVSVMRGATEADIDDVFARINTYGHRLSDQERRQAGVQSDLSTLIRQVACEFRGDASGDILNLSQMPSISVDLPMTKHGYDIVADQVFWVQQGILRATDLRDSLDEQCLADIAASVVSGEIIERSKDALDRVYQSETMENKAILAALDSYGGDKLAVELKFCVDELLKICSAAEAPKLRWLLFKKPSTNAFPAVFALLMIALHESLVGGRKKIADYQGTQRALTNLAERIDTGKGSTTPDERRRNVDTIKGLIAGCLVEGDPARIYGAQSSIALDNIVRRSEVELPHYELKQGILSLGPNRGIDSNIFDKVIHTICAMANNGPNVAGSIVIGVTDKPDDALRVEALDNISPRRVGSRLVVGVKREARFLGETLEEYVARWKHAIRNSTLSQPVRDSVLSDLDYNDYHGLGLLIIQVRPQASMSSVGDDTYWREGDETVRAVGSAKIAELAMRFR